MHRRLHTLRLYYFTSFAALGAYLPYFPRWLEARGIVGLRMGVIAALIPAMGLVSPPAFGLLADTLGLRGALLRLCCAGACVSIGLVAVTSALAWPLGFGGLFLAVLFFALFRAPMVMIADVVALEQAHAADTTYARLRLWGSLGFLVTALVAGRAIDPHDPTALPCLIAAVLLSALLAAWSLPTRAPVPAIPVAGHARALLGAADYRLFLVTSFLAQMANANYDLCFSLHLRDLGWSGSMVGVAWAVAVLGEITLLAFSAPLLARVSPPRLIALATSSAVLRWVLIASIRSQPGLLALQSLHAISFALWWIASLAYTKRRAPVMALATAQGLFSAAVAAGAVVGVLGWGPLYQRAGGGTTFASAAGVSALALFCALVWARRPGALEPLFDAPVDAPVADANAGR